MDDVGLQLEWAYRDDIEGCIFRDYVGIYVICFCAERFLSGVRELPQISTSLARKELLPLSCSHWSKHLLGYSYHRSCWYFFCFT